MNHLFKDLPSHFQFIATDSDGTVTAYTERPRWDGFAWVPDSPQARTHVLGYGITELVHPEESLLQRPLPEFPQLQQDITARQHYAFELFKIACAENAYMQGEKLEQVARTSYRLADMFLKVGEE